MNILLEECCEEPDEDGYFPYEGTSNSEACKTNQSYYSENCTIDPAFFRLAGKVPACWYNLGSKLPQLITTLFAVCIPFYCLITLLPFRNGTYWSYLLEVS